ncbi:MAG: heparan-alpha-glucosaminide N-acetyltransferase domain-containing protein [Microbacterium sp.]
MAAEAGRLKARIDRLDAPKRTAGIDLARGIAVIGMFTAHLVETPEFEWGTPSSWEALAHGNSSILFATLAGVSIALVTGGQAPVARDRAGTARGRIALRAVCIWLIGVLLLGLGTPIYIILPAYGILYLVALPVLRWRAPALFAAALVTAVAGPFLVYAINLWPGWSTQGGTLLEELTGWHYPWVLWAAFVFCGMGIGRLNLRDVQVAGGLAVIGLILASRIYGRLRVRLEGEPQSGLLGTVFSAEPHSSSLLESLGSGGFAMLVIAVCLLICLRRAPRPVAIPVRIITWPLRALGAMPLTAYTLQVVVWAVMQATVGDPRYFPTFWPLTLAMLAFCTLWALLVGRGPLEAGISALARMLVRSRAVT